MEVGGPDTALAATKYWRTLDDTFTATFNKFLWRFCPPGVNCPYAKNE
jgi:hypothetical protein